MIHLMDAGLSLRMMTTKVPNFPLIAPIMNELML